MKIQKLIMVLIMMILASPVSAFQVYGAIGEKWRSLGAERSTLGAPTSDEINYSYGRLQNFAREHILWYPATTNGAHTMFGSIYARYQLKGGADRYGFPITMNRMLLGEDDLMTLKEEFHFTGANPLKRTTLWEISVTNGKSLEATIHFSNIQQQMSLML